jgi:nicotinate dehydrogenase subunit B
VTARAASWRTRRQFRDADGVLLVLRQPPPAVPPAPGQPPSVPANPAEGPEILLAFADDGRAVALGGHVDLGTGLQTAYAQLVAEELDLPLECVTVVLGDTARAPNQGPTIASASIQIHAMPLRQAAAQARAWLREAAARQLGVAADALRFEGGDACAPDGRRVALGTLVAGRHVELMLDPSTALKAPSAHRIIGTPAQRLDIPAKAAGDAVYVHDVRVPGMLHGRVVRPPYAGIDAGDFVGRTLLAVDETSIAHIAGVRKVVVIGDFVGVVAEREDQAEAAMHALSVQWKPWPGLPPLDDLAQAIRANPSTPRVVASQGDVDAAHAASATTLDREYVWPYQMHASIGPSCAVADWKGESMTVWAGTQNPHVLRADLAKLTHLADTAVDVIRLEASGCYGRNGADDVAADAALLSRAVNAPVRVQLTREQEHAWEPKGAAQLMRVRGGLDASGNPTAYDFDTSYPSNAAPTLALLLTRTIEPVARAFEMGDRTAVPPYAYANQRITVNDMAPILRASWLRGVSALPNSFAHESYIDELAHAAGVDPVEYRLRHLKDDRAAELVRAVSDKAGWRVHTRPQQQGADGDWLKGQGFAYARYVHSKFPGFGAAWAAWVADVEVHRVTGDVHVRRVVVGHDAGMMINPAGVQHQVHGNVIQTTSRALKERVSVDPQTRAVTAREWGGYPILSFRDVPVVEVLLMPRAGEPPLGVGESSSVPGTAAIANAIFDATGVRFRQPPFTPEVVRAAMHPLPAPTAAAPPAATVGREPARDPQRARKGLLATVGALAAAGIGLFGAALGWRPAIAPVQLSAQPIYSAAVIERGRQLAALGNCVHCHTADGGAPLAGGRAVETPFGTVVSTNITPDADHGIGRWSFSAFQRAMRDGIARDGRHLYPAFPYPSFTQASDDDLQAIYAWLMAQAAVASAPPVGELRFPFNLRPLMALWNALYLQSGPVAADSARGAPSISSARGAPSISSARGALWNRGAYLVNGIGHCGACHTARDALGAERNDRAYLGGAVQQGWEAPALGALSRSPVPWTEAQFVRYLQRGHDALHGMAGGPMAPVVRGLAQLPPDDVRAIAHYLVSLQADRTDGSAEALLARSREQAARLRGPAQRMFESACGACHHDGDGPELVGLNQPLALNPNLHSAHPDNLLRTLLDGIQDPAFIEIGHMPAFRHALSDAQIVELAAYMRQRFAPGQPAWPDLAGAVARARAQR